MPQVPPVPGAADLGTLVDRAFSDTGALAQALPDFEPREGQRTMALAVGEVLGAGGVLLAEAGTGTGKTLAYLVPAIYSRQRVLVSTGTKNLQEQIYFKDLPVLRAALGIPFTATYMKGRSNYLCLHRFEQARAKGSHPGFDRLADWMRTTETGDRAELDDMPEDAGVWADVSATAETCLGTECPQHHECFVTRMRQRAAESDVVIVNHHLLCADASVRQGSYGEVIPDCHIAVVDEAHQLEEVATQYFGTSVSTYRVDEVVRDVGRALATLAQDDRAVAIRRDMMRMEDHARAFFGAVAMARRARGPVGDERLRIGPDWFGDIVDHGVRLMNACGGLEAALALAGGADTGGGRAAGASGDVLTLARRAGEVRDDMRFLLAADDPAFVYFVETRGRGVFLRAAPIDVAAIVREHILGRLRAASAAGMSD